MTAELLALPCATAVISLRHALSSGKVRVEREIEGGRREVLEVTLPAVLALQTGINRPRYPALSHLLRAGRQGVETIDAARTHLPQGRQVLVGVTAPDRQRQCVTLEGSPQEKAEALLKIMRTKGLLP